MDEHRKDGTGLTSSWGMAGLDDRKMALGLARVRPHASWGMAGRDDHRMKLVLGRQWHQEQRLGWLHSDVAGQDGGAQSVGELHG